MGAARVIYWFRTDLRLHDSPALHAALELKPEVLYPVWTWDPHYVYHARVSSNRWRYLLDCQADVDKRIKKLTGSNGLLVLRGNPLNVLKQALQDWKITHLVFEQDTDTYALSRDTQVRAMAEKLGVKVVSKLGRTLWDPIELNKVHGGKPVMTLAAVQKLGSQIGPVPRPIEAPTSLPSAGDTKLEAPKDEIQDAPDLNEPARGDGRVTSYDQVAGPNGDYSVPTMEEINIKPAEGPYRGGETLALEALEAYMADKKKTATFEKPKTNPGVFHPPETTLLSPHLHFGSLSIRTFYWRVMDVCKAYGSGASKPPASLEGQLLFRDMYFAAQCGIDNFEQTLGNAHCRYIPWRLLQEPDEEAEAWLEAWTHGRTGFPWIDAIMRQLRRDGWIHHLARHSVACFLTRGHCYIAWEKGAQVFEELLIDHETACNVGNWQWLSCTAFFSQYYRVYSPVAFGKKWDKSGALIREFVPELKNVPDKYIYEPWLMSKVDMKAAGCILGQDYPKRIFDEKEQAKVALAGMKEAYDAKLYGDSPQIGKTKSPESPVKSGKKRGQQSLDGFAKKAKIEPAEEHEANEA
ncbi:DNA photolyase [Protomyces lactucae-debilis]|uniref:DNA photolyase n=1 Tax=Protomyces lactucae-debilis TaxID=2754530 RepID=A0A1Y2FSY0_PROLT|nr:DNA photolyase [Protomyces lactucae-debilis]ORY87110.1 DNA photolyase [Protomyces lactucae-debilis]